MVPVRPAPLPTERPPTAGQALRRQTLVFTPSWSSSAWIIAVLIAGSNFTVLRLNPLAISGAPGYTTVTGPAGLPLAEGMPWGRRCQPILFQVDDTVPAQQVDLIQQAVERARALGIDVTFEDQNLGWSPSALYPPGQTSSTMEVVQIAATTETPPLLRTATSSTSTSRGAPTSHPTDGTRCSPVWMRRSFAAVQGDPQATERSVRQLIAFSQGIGASTPPVRASRAAIADAYSSKDLAAMQRMSGCTFEPTS